MRIRFFIGISLFVLLVSCGCGGSAQIEMKDAQEAMNRAMSVHADKFAPTEFQQAQKAWDRGQTAEKEGKASTAKVLFASAKIYYGKAADIAIAKKEALSRELNAIQLMISENLAQVKIDLSKKAVSSNQRSQVETIAAQVDQDNASIGKLVKEENLSKAIATAKNVQTKIYHAQLILAGLR
jgi:hypothetical protein